MYNIYFFTFFFMWFRVDLKGSDKQCKNAGKQIIQKIKKTFIHDRTVRTITLCKAVCFNFHLAVTLNTNKEILMRLSKFKD